jgi:hypothetical protein
VDLCAQLTSDAVLDAAFDWLCRRRLNYSANADVWALRRNWSREKQIIRNELAAGDYRFALLSRVTQSRSSKRNCSGFMRRPGAPRPRRDQNARAEPNHQPPTPLQHVSIATSAACWRAED